MHRAGTGRRLLRREGLYTSHLTSWRKQRKDGALKELGRPRGRKPADRRDAEITALTRQVERSEAELAKMKRVVEIQLAKALIEQAAEQQKITPGLLTLHADCGGPQRAKPVAVLLADLGITKTHSRPYTSSDNPARRPTSRH